MNLVLTILYVLLQSLDFLTLLCMLLCVWKYCCIEKGIHAFRDYSVSRHSVIKSGISVASCLWQAPKLINNVLHRLFVGVHCQIHYIIFFSKCMFCMVYIHFAACSLKTNSIESVAVASCSLKTNQ